MKHLKRLCLFAFVLFMAATGFAQKIELISGDLNCVERGKGYRFCIYLRQHHDG